MSNKQTNFYAPLSAQYHTLSDACLSLDDFARLESVLGLLFQLDPTADPSRAYLLFTGYECIGMGKTVPAEHILQNLRTQFPRNIFFRTFERSFPDTVPKRSGQMIFANIAGNFMHRCVLLTSLRLSKKSACFKSALPPGQNFIPTNSGKKSGKPSGRQGFLPSSSVPWHSPEK